jgi:hypothetical protein
VCEGERRSDIGYCQIGIVTVSQNGPSAAKAPGWGRFGGGRERFPGWRIV